MKLEEINNYLEAYKGYVIRKVGKYMLAIPEDALCFVHDCQLGESNEFVAEQLKQIIDEHINE